jgi:hypothetical protein
VNARDEAKRDPLLGLSTTVCAGSGLDGGPHGDSVGSLMRHRGLGFRGMLLWTNEPVTVQGTGEDSHLQRWGDRIESVEAQKIFDGQAFSKGLVRTAGFQLGRLISLENKAF